MRYKGWLSSICVLVLAGCYQQKSADPSEFRRELGQRLFFDTGISFNNTKSCASCHDPEFAFSDGYRRSVTATGDMTLRNAPSLLNVSHYQFLNWADSGVVSLEEQHRRPLFATTPVELGLKGNDGKIMTRLERDKAYAELFRQSFPEEDYPFHTDNLIAAIADFVRSLNSFASPYDRYAAGDSAALSVTEKAGMALFFSDRTKCGACHVPPLFTLNSRGGKSDIVYRNLGLYNLSNVGGYPQEDTGLAMVTDNSQDNGKFRIPSLRNVALTAPYMHDGSIRTLEEVLTVYESGGRVISAGPDLGDGRQNPNKDRLLTGFTLSREERLQLVDFLHALTDTTWRSDPRFRNPFR